MSESRTPEPDVIAALLSGAAEATLPEIPTLFRCRASMLRQWGGAEASARLWETAAAEVGEALTRHEEERLFLEEAAAESGYTRRHLRRMILDGKLSDDADGRVRRRDLPRKGTASVAQGASPTPTSLTQLARAVAGGET